MTFNTSLDKLAKGITIAVSVLFAAIIIGPYLGYGDGDKTTLNYINLGLLLLYLFVFSLRPTRYTLTTEQLIIHRPLSNVKIDRDQIKSIEPLDKAKLGRAIRTFGVGGLFGYFGKFASTKLGSMTWYATNRNKTILMTTIEDKKIVISPDHPEQLIAHFNL